MGPSRLKSSRIHPGSAPTPRVRNAEVRGSIPSAPLSSTPNTGDLYRHVQCGADFLKVKYGAELAAKNPEDEGLILQWSFGVVSECEPHAITVFTHRFPRSARTPSDAEAAQPAATLEKPLKVLDGAHATKPYLLGNRFTVADLNVASILSGAKAAGLDLSRLPHVKRWLSDCLRRPTQRETVSSMAGS